MKANVGTLDRVIRVLVGIVIFCAGYQTKHWWGLLALIPWVTAFVRFCPFYRLFGVSTCPAKPELPE